MQVYKEYRNFMINKHREDVKRRLTFTECRKLLAGVETILCSSTLQQPKMSMVEGWKHVCCHVCISPSTECTHSSVPTSGLDDVHSGYVGVIALCYLGRQLHTDVRFIPVALAHR